ncbi:MAG: HAD family hydrolase [Oscillospiraceae bacterium]|nr:HAD family hydrolase [Candidatus Ruminococcus equi]
MYQNYVFDLYGTLVDIRTDESADEFWEKVAKIFLSYGAVYSPKELNSLYRKYTRRELFSTILSHPNYKSPDIHLEKVFSKLLKHRGVTPTYHKVKDIMWEFRKASTKFIKLYDGVIDLLDSLKEKGKHIFLLSNAQEYFTVPELKLLGIYDYFDGILISSQCCCTKPDKHFFNILFDRYNLEKDKTVMIGNDWHYDIEGAYNFGIDSLYIHQDISSPIDNIKLKSKWSILDGDVEKIKPLILR